MNEYIIYTRRIAYLLRKQGYKIIRTEPNPNKPEFDCYVFEDSEGLQDMLHKVKNVK